jgi:phage terminase large subunit
MYTPRPHQAELHRTMKRFNVLVAHRRFGKGALYH